MKSKSSLLSFRYFTFSRLLFLFFLAILVGIITISFLFYHNNETLQNRNLWLIHTHNVIEKAEEVSALSKELQWESRTTLLNGDTSYAASYHDSRAALQTNVARLKELTSDNSPQQLRVDK